MALVPAVDCEQHRAIQVGGATMEGRTVRGNLSCKYMHHLKTFPCRYRFVSVPFKCASAVVECCCTSRLWGCKLRAFSTS